MHWMHQGPKHLGAQTRATGTRTPNPEVEESTRSMRPKKTLKQACFQGYPESAVYVQIPVGSRNSASRNAYHTSLRPSSLFEPRHPSLKVVRKQSPCGGYRQRENETTHYIEDNTLCPDKARTQTSAGIPGSHGSRSLTPSSDHRLAENPPTDEGSQGVVHGESVETHCVNDPSAGSPTETLLRLLLPLSDKVH